MGAGARAAAVGRWYLGVTQKKRCKMEKRGPVRFLTTIAQKRLGCNIRKVRRYIIEEEEGRDEKKMGNIARTARSGCERL